MDGMGGDLEGRTNAPLRPPLWDRATVFFQPPANVKAMRKHLSTTSTFPNSAGQQVPNMMVNSEEVCCTSDEYDSDAEVAATSQENKRPMRLARDKIMTHVLRQKAAHTNGFDNLINAAGTGASRKNSMDLMSVGVSRKGSKEASPVNSPRRGQKNQLDPAEAMKDATEEKSILNTVQMMKSHDGGDDCDKSTLDNPASLDVRCLVCLQCDTLLDWEDVKRRIKAQKASLSPAEYAQYPKIEGNRTIVLP